MKAEAFNQVANILKDNKGKSRAVHITLKDRTNCVILRVDENGTRTGGYSVNGVEDCICWTYVGGNFIEEHITPLDSVIDVYVNVIAK